MKRSICLFVLCAALTLPFFTVRASGASAAAWAVMDGDTGVILAEQNGHTMLPCASTTKIMTALVALEAVPGDRAVTICREDTLAEGSRMYLREGETVTVADLLYGLLLASGNDAALALARACAGSEAAFVARMNEKAAALGMRDTHFSTASGLDAPDHRSSACDLALLMAAAMRTASFAQITGTREKVLPGRTVVNHNRLLHTVPGVDGGKTGYTDRAGRCLVTTATRNGRRLIVVTLNDPEDWHDHAALYDRYFGDYTAQPVPSDAVPALSVPVVNGTVPAVRMAFEAPSVFLREGEQLRAEIYLPRFVYAPACIGDPVGEIRWFIGSREAARCALTAAEASEDAYEAAHRTAY